MALSLFFGSTPLVSEPHATVLLRSLRLALLSGALFSMSPAMALDAVVVAGKTCPANTTPVTYQEAVGMCSTGDHQACDVTYRYEMSRSAVPAGSPADQW